MSVGFCFYPQIIHFNVQTGKQRDAILFPLSLMIFMQDVQDIFKRIQVAKKQQKDLKAAYNDALKGTPEYNEINDKLKTLRERKKQIENTIKESFGSELTKIEDLKIDIASDMEMLSDIALTQVMKGETVQVTDEYNNTYDPIFSVKFKKTS